MPQHLQATAQHQGGDGLSHHRMTSARRTAAGHRSGRRPRPGCVNPREGVDSAEPTGIPQGRPAQGGDGAEPTGIPQGQPPAQGGRRRGDDRHPARAAGDANPVTAVRADVLWVTAVVPTQDAAPTLAIE